MTHTNADETASAGGRDNDQACCNPGSFAALRTGETVLDLGSGAGFDSFLAARQVGPSGRVIGVDTTPEVVSRARANARKVASTNVEFRLGEIDNLPVADASVDVILFHCVTHRSPEKQALFREAFRVLRAGGRLAISDVVDTAAIPLDAQGEVQEVPGCVAGAVPVEEFRRLLHDAGFDQVDIRVAPGGVEAATSTTRIDRVAASVMIEATKPSVAAKCCGPECCS